MLCLGKDFDEHLERVLEEESFEQNHDISMVLWDMSPEVNLIEDDEVMEEILAMKTRRSLQLNHEQFFFNIYCKENMDYQS